MGKFDDEFNSAFGSTEDNDYDMLFGSHPEDSNGLIEEEELDDEDTAQFSGTSEVPEESEEDKEKKKSFKKTGIMLAGIGIALLIFIALLLNLVGHAKAKKAQEQQGIQVQTTTQASDEVVDLGGKKTKDKTKETQAPAPAQKVEVVKDPYNWVEVDLTTTDLTFKEPIESIFTITEIKTYARFSGNSKDTQIKAIVMGNISGLVGTYTLELPADKAAKLSIGMSFSITYQLKQMDGYKLVGDIQY